MRRDPELISKAKRFLRSAELLFDDGDYDSVASRCYYSMFLATEAMLHAKGLRSHTHKGSMGLFGQHLVRPGDVDAVHGKALRTAFDLRQRGDYAIGAPVDKNDARVLLDQTRAFIDMAETWLRRTG